MKTLKRIVAVMMTVLMLITTLSVGITTSAASKKVKKIKLNKTSITLYVGETYKLKATVSPSNATNKKVSWSSSNKKVATVSSSGKITAKKKGTVTITVKAKDGSGKKATCKVTVQNKPVKSVKLNKSSVTLCTNASVKLKATVSPSNATNKNVTWKSSNTKVATVSSSGKVTAKKKGTATITVTTKDGKKKATCKVKVTSIGVSSLSLNKTSVTGAPGGSTTLKATVKPSNADNQKLSWKSSNTKVATVSSSGKVKFVKDGTATITATTTDGTKKSVTCKVTVRTVKVTSIKLSASSVSGVSGGSKTLTATVSPTNASIKTLKWTSSNTNVATVDSNGTVRYLKEGTATITAAATDGSGKKATCKVTVTPKTSEIIVYTTNFAWYKGKTAQMTATVKPTGASTKVTWSSSNTRYATVDENGKVTVIKDPTFLDGDSKDVTITATATDGSGVKGSYTISIKEKVDVESIAFATNNTTGFFTGQEYDPLVTFEPTDASETAVTFTSSNPAVAKVQEDGSILMVSAGTAVITATSVDNKSATATTEITVKDPSLEFSSSSRNVNCLVGDTVELAVLASPKNLVTDTGLDFEVADDSVLKFMGYTAGGVYGVGSYYKAQFKVVGDGVTTVKAIAGDGLAVSEQVATVSAIDLSVDTYYEGLSEGDKFKVNAQIVMGDEILLGTGIQYSMPYDYIDYIDYEPHTDGTATVEILKDLPDSGASLQVKYTLGNSTVAKTLYFMKSTYTYPTGDTAALLSTMKTYSADAAKATSSTRDKEINFINTNVTRSNMDMEIVVTLENFAIAAPLNAFLAANKDSLLQDMGMNSDDIVYELFTQSQFESEETSAVPKAIGCDASAVSSVTVNKNEGDVTYDMVLKLKDQANTALSSVAASSYGKTMPVLDKAYINGFTTEIKNALGSNAANSVSCGTVNQTYKGGYVILTINKITNKVEKCEYYFKSDMTVDNAEMIMAENMEGFGDLKITTTADFTMTVEEKMTYYNLAY